MDKNEKKNRACTDILQITITIKLKIHLNKSSDKMPMIKTLVQMILNVVFCISGLY